VIRPGKFGQALEFPACYNFDMPTIVTVDIGGTQIRVATFSPDSIKPLQIKKIPTKAAKSDPYTRVVEAIESLWPEEGMVLCISAAIPGPVDPHTGVIASTPNIEGWKDFPLAEKLQAHFMVPVYLGNDANLAALGEWKYGAGQGHKDLLYLTISTGIGGGVIADNHPLEGAHGLGGELGHVTVLPNGPRCGCGQRGHLESVAAGPAIVRYVNEQLAKGETSSLQPGENLTAREISAAARNGDALAISALARAGKYIGKALADFLVIFNPTIVIFGGGVSFSGEFLFNPMRNALKNSVMDDAYLDGLVITTAQLGDDAGLLGSLALAKSKIKHDN
jgi:glucokinase